MISKPATTIWELIGNDLLGGPKGVTSRASARHRRSGEEQDWDVYFLNEWKKNGRLLYPHTYYRANGIPERTGSFQWVGSPWNASVRLISIRRRIEKTSVSCAPSLVHCVGFRTLTAEKNDQENVVLTWQQREPAPILRGSHAIIKLSKGEIDQKYFWVNYKTNSRKKKLTLIIFKIAPNFKKNNFYIIIF